MSRFFVNCRVLFTWIGMAGLALTGSILLCSKHVGSMVWPVIVLVYFAFFFFAGQYGTFYYHYEIQLNKALEATPPKQFIIREEP